MFKRIVAVLVIAALLIALLLYSQWKTGPFRVSGFIEAQDIGVGSRVGGRVQSVHVEEGDVVHKGDLVLELEPFDLMERKSEAEANLAQRQAELDKLVAGFRVEEILQAKARVDQSQARLTKLLNGPRPEEILAAQKEVEEAQSRLELATSTHRRIESLFAKGASTQEELDQATNGVRVARAALDVKKQQLSILQQGTRVEEIDEARAQLREAEEAWKLREQGYRPEEIAEARAAVQAAAALVRAFEQQIGELSVRAPVDSVVEAVELEPGDLVGANVPAISLLDTSKLWVRTYVPENRMDIRYGQQVRVSVDSFPGKRFAGRVTYVSQQAEFTPRNIQTPEERSKQVFRVKVTLQGETQELHPGMSADVWFDDEGR